MTTPNTPGLIQTASETGSPAKINLEVGQEMATGATSLHITGLMKWPKPAILKLNALFENIFSLTQEVAPGECLGIISREKIIKP